MPTPFSVAAAQRTGTFFSPEVNYDGVSTTIFWQYTIPNQAEYENPANSVTADLFINGVNTTNGSGLWTGGAVPSVTHNGVVIPADPPPARQFNLSHLGLTTADKIKVGGNIVGTYTIGIQNGLIS